MQWWGYSKEHGWVVLDRSISANRPGVKGDLLFFRCRDSTTYLAKRATWEVPAYTFAKNYLRGLSPEDSAREAAELEAFESRWPEFELEIGRQQEEAAARAEAARLEAEPANFTESQWFSWEASFRSKTSTPPDPGRQRSRSPSPS